MEGKKHGWKNKNKILKKQLTDQYEPGEQNQGIKIT